MTGRCTPPPTSPWRPLADRALLAVLALLATAGCGLQTGTDGPAAGSAASPDRVPVEVTASAGPDGVQRVRIHADDSFRYRPAVVHARTGRVEIELRTTGQTPHDVNFPRFSAAVPHTESGASRTAVFDVPRPGTYEFVCSYHARAGMTGRLVVTQ